MGYRYDASTIVWPDAGEPPRASVTEYVQSTFPGARAPHAWLAPGRSTLDAFGKGYCVLRVGNDAPEVAVLAEEARRRRVPFEAAAIDGPPVRAVYDHKLVLVRPDGHVAWRGDALPEARAVIARVTGGA